MKIKLFVTLVLINIIFLLFETHFYHIDDKFFHLFEQRGKIQGVFYLLSIFVSNILITSIFFIKNPIAFFIGIFVLEILFSIDIGYYIVNNNVFNFNDMAIVFSNPNYIFEATKTFSNIIIPIIIIILSLILFAFLRKKIVYRTIPNNDTIIFYTSDHGQSILENNILATHCTSNNPPISQGIVPIFIIHNKQDKRWDILKQNIYSHFNIMPIILQVAGYDGNITKNNFFEVNSTNKIDWFFSGDIFGRTKYNKNRVGNK